MSGQETDPVAYCHRPVIVRDPQEPLGRLVEQLRFDPAPSGDHVITNDTILLWTSQPRLVTGADLLWRLLRGIVKLVPEAQAR